MYTGQDAVLGVVAAFELNLAGGPGLMRRRKAFSSASPRPLKPTLGTLEYFTEAKRKIYLTALKVTGSDTCMR